ncbi:MAG: hypothetical protein AAGH15_06375 [Myxococcota bacterium]
MPHRAFFVAVLLFALVGPMEGASADDGIVSGLSFTVQSYQRVRVTVTNESEAPEQVRFPTGTLLGTGDGAVQDLMLGEAIDVELAPGEKRAFLIETYCMQQDRREPSGDMAVIGVAKEPFVRLLSLREGQSQSEVQAMVWALAARRDRLPDVVRTR